MRKNYKLLEGSAAIDAAIKDIGKVAQNINERIQIAAVSIIAHAAGAGKGDVSRALSLCQTVKRFRSMNVNYLVGFFRYFGSTNVNLAKGKVSVMDRKAKGYRGFDVDGARANCWFDAVGADGERATWYQGPVPETYEPGGIGDVASTIHNFVKRTAERLDGTKTVGNKEVPLFNISKEDREQLDNALAFMDRLAATLARKEDIAALTEAREQAVKEAAQDTEVLAVIQTKAPEEKAVA